MEVIFLESRSISSHLGRRVDSDNLDSYTDKHNDWNLVFAHHKEEDKIYPLTITEIADAQRKDQELKVYFKKNTKMPQKDIFE